MNATSVLRESQLTSVKKIGQGKVRDIYQADDTHLIIVASDRISAFDVILPDAIPGKGRLLTQISLFWFEQLKHIVPNHLSDQPLSNYLTRNELKQLDGRGMLVKMLRPLPFEAVVRGYIAGSGWNDYQQSGRICGIEMAQNLSQAQQLEQPIFTPATKAAVGEHDENISFQQLCDLIGSTLAHQTKEISLRIYHEASTLAQSKGIIIADTKFEFGLDQEDRIVLIDEALTYFNFISSLQSVVRFSLVGVPENPLSCVKVFF